MTTDGNAPEPAGGTPVERRVRRPSLDEVLAILSRMADGACKCDDLSTDCERLCSTRIARNAIGDLSEIMRHELAMAVQAQRPNEFAHLLTPGVLWDMYAQ